MPNISYTKDGYTVDHFYQWDTAQVLAIYGLSLGVAPEVHFADDSMQMAIVRQATVDASGVIRVEVPDYVLQQPNRVNAFICIRGDNTFSTLYKFIIPVIARAMPSDYEGEDEAEVYSLEALRAEVIMLAPNADATVEKVLNPDGTWTLRFKLPRGEFTDADKQEVVAAVLAALPAAEGATF